jgi:hypothetical protein
MLADSITFLIKLSIDFFLRNCRSKRVNYRLGQRLLCAGLGSR